MIINKIYKKHKKHKHMMFEKRSTIKETINQFHATGFFRYPLKT